MFNLVGNSEDMFSRDTAHLFVCADEMRSKKEAFWPPLKPKIDSYLTTFSLDCFIR